MNSAGQTAKPRLPERWCDDAHHVSILELAKDYGANLKSAGLGEFCGPCPVCGGNDRFSVNTRKNVFNCRMCSKGGGPITLARFVHGWDYRTAVCDIVGQQDPANSSSSLPATRRQPVPAAKRQTGAEENAFRMRSRKSGYEKWKSALRFHPTVEAYFAVRGLALPESILKRFRFIEDLDYVIWNKTSSKWDVIHSGNAIVAPIVGPDDRFIGLHRAWIDIEKPKGKAEIIDPNTGELLVNKKVLGSHLGGRIVLRDDGETEDLIFGEGYESVLSFDVIHERPEFALWTGVNRGNMCGRAANKVRHPTRKNKTKLGHLRVVKVGGDEPDLTDLDSLIIPERFNNIIQASDMDGDWFESQCTRMRGVRRHEKIGTSKPRTVTDHPPSYGNDWNDQRMKEMGLIT